MKAFIRQIRYPASGYSTFAVYRGEPGSRDISLIDEFMTRRQAERHARRAGYELVTRKRPA